MVAHSDESFWHTSKTSLKMMHSVTWQYRHRGFPVFYDIPMCAFSVSKWHRECNIRTRSSNSIRSGNAIVPLSAINDPLLLCKWGDQHRKPHSTTHFNQMRSWAYLFEAPDPRVCFVCSEFVHWRPLLFARTHVRVYSDWTRQRQIDGVYCIKIIKQRVRSECSDWITCVKTSAWCFMPSNWCWRVQSE